MRIELIMSLTKFDQVAGFHQGYLMASSEGLLRNEKYEGHKGWAVAYLFSGAMTFFFCSFVDPLFGSSLILLGILNLMIKSRWVFLVNSLGLAAIAVMTLIKSVDFGLIKGSAVLLPSLGIVLGLLEVGWGIQELRHFIRSQTQNQL